MTTDKTRAVLMRAEDAAELLMVTPRTLWSLTAPRGPIPVIRVGRSVRYAVKDLEAYIDSQRVSQSPQA